MLTNVMYTTLYATDQDRALDVLHGGLGLEKRVRLLGPRRSVPDGGRPRQSRRDHPLVWRCRCPAPPGAEEPGTVPGPVILESDDLKSDVETFRGRGVTFEEPEPVAYAFGVRITAIDPDGNRSRCASNAQRGRDTCDRPVDDAGWRTVRQPARRLASLGSIVIVAPTSRPRLSRLVVVEVAESLVDSDGWQQLAMTSLAANSGARPVVVQPCREH